MKVWEWDLDLTETLEVEYEFDFGEPEVLYYADGSGQPASPPQVSFLKFVYNGTDVTELIEQTINASLIDDLELDIIEFEESCVGRVDWEDYWDRTE